jgi:2-methylcitrate dehydratase PrpD
MAHLTADIGRFDADLDFDSIPEPARAIAKTGFADCYAVMVAGARGPVVGLVDRTLAGVAAEEGASLVPAGERRRLAGAAPVNGSPRM